MKNLIFTFSILIILFKTGNVLSDSYIFNVNNIEISKKNSKNKEKSFNKAFKKAFEKLINRLLLEKDYKKISNTNLIQIKELFPIIKFQKKEKKKNKKVNQLNVSFDKDRMHNFFYKINIFIQI